MRGLSPELLKLLAALACGGAAALLAVVAYQLLRSEKIGAYVQKDVSQRRAARRRQAVELSPLYAWFLRFLRGPAGVVARLDLAALRQYVHRPYAQAGYPGGLDDDEVVTVGLLLSLLGSLAIGGALAVFGGIGWAWAGLCTMPLGFLAVISSLQTRGQIRQRQILVAMPYVLDLLVLILRSGTSLNLALVRVVGDHQSDPIGEELGQVLSEIEMGSSRAEAMRRFAQRLNHPDIVGLADSIVQSEELGWPLADTLMRQSDRMAAERVLRAQNKAGAAGVLVMLPSTLVLLAAVLLLFGPWIVRLLQGQMALR